MFFNAISIKTSVCACITVNGRNPVSVDMENLERLFWRKVFFGTPPKSMKVNVGFKAAVTSQGRALTG